MTTGLCFIHSVQQGFTLILGEAPQGWGSQLVDLSLLKWSHQPNNVKQKTLLNSFSMPVLTDDE